MKLPHALRFCMLAALALAGTAPARDQLLQGTIDGNVTDPTQAAVVGAKVAVTSEQTNFTRDTLTNAAGGYTLVPLIDAADLVGRADAIRELRGGNGAVRDLRACLTPR